MTEMLEAALAYARTGWRVFPVGQNKQPLTPHGFKDASKDERLIRDWWERQWPGANIALDIPEGLVVLDFDPRNGAPDVGDVLGEQQCTYTMTCETPSGGVHLYLRVPEGVEFIGRWMQGIDVKAAGKGYVLLPPARTEAGEYLWWDISNPLEHWSEFDTVIYDMPDWLLNVLRKPDVALAPRGPDAEPAAPMFPWELGTSYGIFGLQQQLGLLSMTGEGERNRTLNRVGFRVGQLVAGGELKEDALHHVARVAEWIGLEKREVYQTLHSSYEAGLQKPWQGGKDA